MPQLPEYKPGDYLECGEDYGYSKVLILSENRCLVKAGRGIGYVLTLDEWYVIIGDNRATIQNTTKLDECKGCPYFYELECSSTEHALNNQKFKRSISHSSLDSGSGSGSIRSSVSFSDKIQIRTPISANVYYEEHKQIDRNNISPRDVEIRYDEAAHSEGGPYEGGPYEGGPYEDKLVPAIIPTNISSTNPKRSIPWYYKISLCGIFDA